MLGKKKEEEIVEEDVPEEGKKIIPMGGKFFGGKYFVNKFDLPAMRNIFFLDPI